jgi:hypothetical protein
MQLYHFVYKEFELMIELLHFFTKERGFIGGFPQMYVGET